MITPEQFLNDRIRLFCGDSRDVIKQFPDNYFDSLVCDPPYALVSIVKRFANSPRSEATENTENPYGRTGRGFMGQKWDNGETAFATEFWAECLRVLKPGGHVVAFSGTRTYHRMACAIEDAGFEVRDMLSWLYGSGFPKSHDVSKGIDKAAGVEFEARPAAGVGFMGPDGPGGYNVTKNQLSRRGKSTDDAVEWQGWGTALKPACEPICFGRKPMRGTVASNVLEHGTGAINIDGCRVGTESTIRHNHGGTGNPEQWRTGNGGDYTAGSDSGRWPANIIHDGSNEVIAAFPDAPGQQFALKGGEDSKAEIYGKFGPKLAHEPRNDSGSAARFFYTAKADADDRLGSKHPTVKPVDLMQWLCRLVTPKGGTVLDPFAGTGTTGEAAFREGFNAVLIEREAEYQADIRRRMALVMSGPEERKRESIKAKVGDVPFEPGSLFAGIEGQAAAE